MATKKVKYLELLNIFACLKSLGEGKSKAWYGIARNQQRVLKALQSYEEEYKQIKEKVVDTLCNKDEDGKPKTVVITDPNSKKEAEVYDFGTNQEEATKLLSELDQKEIEVDFYEISMDAFETTKGEDKTHEENQANMMMPLLDVIIIE